VDVSGHTRWVALALLALLAWQGWDRYAASPAPDPVRASPAVDRSDQAALPAEARQTLRLIASGGPFPYERDGVVFGNFEKRLPLKPRGYYHEYTVPTPGLSHRGARRVVAGGRPPTEFYYTDDHYGSFRRIEGEP
jgi:ribonuclease T1